MADVLGAFEQAVLLAVVRRETYGRAILKEVLLIPAAGTMAGAIAGMLGGLIGGAIGDPAGPVRRVGA